MSIVRRDFPTASAPVDSTDYQKTNTLIDKLFMKSQQIWNYGGSYYLPKGLIFYHGGTVYEVTANEAISGSFSYYIKLTKSGDGSTCTASFVSSLTGITWNDSYNGYYDSSDNLVLVDEFYIANYGSITPKTALGRLGSFLRNLPSGFSNFLTLGGNVVVGGSLSINGDGLIYNGPITNDYFVKLSDLFIIRQRATPPYDLYLEIALDDVDIDADTMSITGSTLDLNTSLLPDETPTSGSQSIGATSEWTPPRGVYTFSVPNNIQVRTSGSTSVNNWGGGALFCDGTKVKLYNNSAGSLTVYYERF